MNIVLSIVYSVAIFNVAAKISNDHTSNRLSDHTVVTDSNVFPYVVAVLKKQSYLSAGALLDDKWVLTAADAFFLVRESTRIIRVRLGSINYKKEGELLPVKTIEVHPYFDDSKPVFDVALIRLASAVRLTPALYPVRMQERLKEVTATHFIVTAWTPSMLRSSFFYDFFSVSAYLCLHLRGSLGEVPPYFDDSKPVFDVALIRLASAVRLTPALYPVRMQERLKEVTATHFIVTAWTPTMKVGQKSRHPISIDAIKRRRMLSISHLHPADRTRCAEELLALGITNHKSLMCLDPDFKTDPCWRDTGAPVVLNGVLWGIISSYQPDNCRSQASSHFVTLAAAPAVRAWVHATTRGHRWNETDNSMNEELERGSRSREDSYEID